jgi:hypothetical protein
LHFGCDLSSGRPSGFGAAGRASTELAAPNRTGVERAE